MEPHPINPADLPREPIPTDLLEWARQTFDVEDFMADVREIERTGGIKSEDLIAELKARFRSK